MNEIPNLTVKELLERMSSEYAAWKAALVNVPFDRMETPLEEGGWSVKDHISHIAWFEREMLRLIETHSLASGSPYWYQETDERNRLIHEENRARPLADIMREADITHARLVQLLASLSDEDLNSAAHFTAMPDDWVPWIIFAQNTYEHYRDHANTIQAHL